MFVIWLKALPATRTRARYKLVITPYEMVFGQPARMPIDVELGVPLCNPNSQSDYSQSLQKAIQHSNQITRRNLEIARTRQASQFNSKSQID